MKKIVKGLDSMLSIYDIIKGWCDCMFTTNKIITTIAFIFSFMVALVVGFIILGAGLGIRRAIVCLLS